jgi:diguanylate cyclase (GGDEF)-like protein
MISLRQYIDGWNPQSAAFGPGDETEANTSRPGTDPAALANHEKKDEPPAEQWLAQTLRRLEADEREMKVLIGVIAKTVHSVAERDERYAREVGGVAQRLRSVASFKDLVRVRHAVASSAGSLTVCVERIAEDGRDSLRLLSTRIKDYRSRADTPERDFSAGDSNRRLPSAEQWAERASLRLQADKHDLKEILDLVDRAIDSVAGRDERYAREVGDIAQRLRSTASLKDLARVRQALVECAGSLTACVERIAEDGKESLERPAGKMEACQSRLDSADLHSPAWDLSTDFRDPRRLEEFLNVKIGTGHRFSLIRIVLSDLGGVNIRFGELAVDDLLKQFALELRRQFPAADLVARCGEDEFAVIVPTSCEEAELRVHRIRRAALGDYKVKSAERFVVIGIDAAIGVVAWDGSESGQALLTRSKTTPHSG